MKIKLTKINEKPAVPAFNWDAIRDLHRNDPPAESFTVERYREQFDLTEDVAAKRVYKLYKDGKLERGKFGVRYYYWKPKTVLTQRQGSTQGLAQVNQDQLTHDYKAWNRA